MTFQEFMTTFKLKNSATVRSWIENGYIPGADYEADFIPDNSRPPYTKARAEKPSAIYVSIVKGLIEGYRPIPAFYKTITPDVFYSVYMANLIECGYVIENKDSSLGVSFYFPSAKAQKYVLENENVLKKNILDDIQLLVTAASLFLK